MATADLHRVHRLPTAQEYLSLRASVGWRVPTAADAARALENSLFGVCATDVGDTVPMARVIGDGAFYFYIQDLVVEPSYQGRGLGRSIVDDIERRIVEVCGPNASLLLVARRDVSGFYRSLGYDDLPDEILGKRLRDG